MNDLRHDPNVQYITHSDRLGTYEELQVRSSPNVGVPTKPKPKPAEAFAAIRAKFGEHFDAMDPDQLRTVPMPDLRSPQARALDAQARDMLRYDTRTEDERLLTELVRLVDCLQGISLRLEIVEGAMVHFGRTCEEQARTIADLTAYIRDHSEGDE